MTATASQLRPSCPNSKTGWREAQVEARYRRHKAPPTWRVRNSEVKRSASFFILILFFLRGLLHPFHPLLAATRGAPQRRSDGGGAADHVESRHGFNRLTRDKKLFPHLDRQRRLGDQVAGVWADNAAAEHPVGGFVEPSNSSLVTLSSRASDKERPLAAHATGTRPCRALTPCALASFSVMSTQATLGSL
jgi:hypothetical protein